ncbi:MAG: DUF1998 domain-containing protein [Gemmatimonadetes bacterium]|nr:DUF1998 domain-containing protein [Gemmatimonadota bacterium]
MTRGIGALRRSQMVTSFGPGATIDLPDHSVIIGGLDWWPAHRCERIVEPRLEEVLARALSIPRVDLRSPPADDDKPGSSPVGVGVEIFPLWFVAEHVVKRGAGRSRPLAHRNHLTDGKYEVARGVKVPVTPVRFVQACLNGHIADIEWFDFTHGGPTSCRRQLWLDEVGTSGDLTDQQVRCECGKERALVLATRPDVLGVCKGQRPWLPRGEQCGAGGAGGQMMRLLIRTASNAYYPQKLSVLSLPESGDRARNAVQSVWDVLVAVEDAATLGAFRNIPKVKEALADFSDEIVLQHIHAVRSGERPPRRKIKIEEFEALNGAGESLGEDRPEGIFFARRHPMPSPTPTVLAAVDHVVLVHRLREVTAQLGFTRFEPVVPDLQGELDLAVRRAALATEVSWLPAMEARGEGFFLSFKDDVLEAWRQRPEVQRREAAFRRTPKADALPINFDARYVFLHSLAHLLITAVSLDCGYNASSLRERVYVTPQGCGILIYTGTTDAEGTLGGLVAAGRRIEKYLAMALELARLCSNDPICAQHSPDQLLEEKYTLGAACHGCLLIAETSCERRNELLDRSLVVSTVEQLGCEFFG